MSRRTSLQNLEMENNNNTNDEGTMNNPVNTDGLMSDYRHMHGFVGTWAEIQELLPNDDQNRLDPEEYAKLVQQGQKQLHAELDKQIIWKTENQTYSIDEELIKELKKGLMDIYNHFNKWQRPFYCRKIQKVGKEWQYKVCVLNEATVKANMQMAEKAIRMYNIICKILNLPNLNIEIDKTMSISKGQKVFLRWK